MIGIPKLHRQVRDFLLSETGFISKRSVLSAGLLAVGVSLFSSLNSKVVSAVEHANVNVQHVSGHCVPRSGYDIAGNDVNRDIYLRPSCTEPGSDDQCDNYCGTTNQATGHCNISALPYIDNHVNDNGGDSEGASGDLVFDDVNTHANSLSLTKQGTMIVATHSHLIEPCPTKLHFSSNACDDHCNNSVSPGPTCSCDETCLAYNIEEIDGTKNKVCNTYNMG